MTNVTISSGSRGTLGRRSALGKEDIDSELASIDIGSTAELTVITDPTDGKRLSHRFSDLSISSSRASHFSRRFSKLDDTARPIAPDRETAKANRITARLDCANLRFGNISVVGRDGEIAILREKYERARGDYSNKQHSSALNRESQDPSNDFTNHIKKQLCLIAGASGCGKSKLASTLADRVEKNGGLFVSGKYDQMLSVPYSAIIQACNEIVGNILQLKHSNNDEGSDEKYSALKEKISSELGKEIELLVNAIPALGELVGESTTFSYGQDVDLEQSKDQFHYLFKKFIRIFTSGKSFGTPLVVVLDDLQWADNASIELLELLLTDRESSGLMVIGCYRSDEVNDEHILSKAVHDLKESQQVATTQLEVDQLSVSNVNTMLMELLSIDDVGKTMPLAELCHQRTLGNPFHLIVFLRMLQEEKLLEFNVGSFSWKFDLDLIESKTSATLNVVDMVAERLGRLPASLQEVLSIAACLGSSFDSELVYLVWKELRADVVQPNLDAHIDRAVEEHIIEIDLGATGLETTYRFSHDKLQEAIFCILEDSNQESDFSMQFRVGLVLLKKFNEKELDQSTAFIISNLMENGALEKLNEDQCLELAKVNLQAAQKATSCSAFKSAARYVENGIALLPADAFGDHYGLALEFHSLGAEVEGSVGNTLAMTAYCEQVIDHASSPLDKSRCYNVQLMLLGTTNAKEACSMCLDFLDELGCKIPRKSILQKVKGVMALKKIKDVDTKVLEALPLMTDKSLLVTMNILNKLSTCAFSCGNTFLLILATYNLYDLSLKHGLSPITASGAFSGLAVVRCALSDFKGATRFADQALGVMKKFDSKPDLSRTYYICHFMVKAWSSPFVSGMKFLQESYRAGLQCGDTESAAWSILMYMLLAFMSGTKLSSVITDIRTYLPQVQELGHHEQAIHMKICFHSCLRFMGLSTHEAIPDVKEFEKELKSMESELAPACYLVHKSFQHAIFGEHEKGAALALKQGDACFRSSAGPPVSMFDTFARGISLFEMARRTKKLKHKKAARKTLATLRKWVSKDSNPNVVHTLLILEAEQYALKGDAANASKIYEKSISFSSRTGMIQDAAMASERYGEFCLNVLNDDKKAAYYLKKARTFYSDWGATAKVEQMNDKYASLQSAHVQDIL